MSKLCGWLSRIAYEYFVFTRFTTMMEPTATMSRIQRACESLEYLCKGVTGKFKSHISAQTNRGPVSIVAQVGYLYLQWKALSICDD